MTNRRYTRKRYAGTTPMDVDEQFNRLKDLPYEYWNEATWRSMDRSTAERHQKKQFFLVR